MKNDRKSKFSWVPDAPAERNTFAIFRRRFDLPQAPEHAQLRLFADTRFRLRVNGTIVGYGPARFHPSAPEFDTFDLTPLLAPGPNTILVEVWSAQSPNFQSIMAPPVFWSAGEVRLPEGSRVSLGSPGEWTGHVSRACERDAVPWSFAIGPVEILDSTALETAFAQPGCPVVPVCTLHGDPRPRSIPAAEETLHFPAKVLHLGSGSQRGEQRLGAFRLFSDFCPAYEGEKVGNAICAAWIHSPRSQSVEIGLFWGDHFLNGHLLDRTDDPIGGNRQSAQADFREGWNFLIAKFSVFGDVWGLPFGLPASAGLSIASRPEASAESAFWMSGLIEGTPLGDLDLRAVEALPAEHIWSLVPTDSIHLAPAREVGWDLALTRTEPVPLAPGQELCVNTGPDGLAILTTEFRVEFLGRPRFTLTCAHPCTVDVTSDEFLRPDGTVDIFRGLFTVHSTDRYLLPAGTHSVETFHNRGGQFLQLNIRSLPSAEVRVSGLGVSEAKTPAAITGDFVCDDDLTNWCWKASCETLHASLEDIWSDSPWREQGCYLGDSLVQFHAHACLSADMRLPARILRLWAQCQNPDGQIPGVVPAHMTLAHQDFTLLYIRFVRDYWALSGDASVVRDVWPAIERILASITWIESAEGLITCDTGRLFIDWSVEEEARQGQSSVLNALFLDALTCAATLAPLTGADPSPLLKRHARMLEAFNTQLWDEETGRYLCTILPDGTRVAGRALHANALAWARGIADETQSARILPWLLGELEDNAQKIIRHHAAQSERPRTTSGQIEPYFLFYLLDALGECGEAAAAEEIIGNVWGVMRDHGAVTLWESIVQTYFNDGSRCHSWSAAPLIHASRRILGVTRPTPGDPDHIRIQPLAHGITRASGSAPHPRGPIQVAWSIFGDEFRITVRHPVGLRMEVLPPPNAPHLRALIDVAPADNMMNSESLAQTKQT